MFKAYFSLGFGFLISGYNWSFRGHLSVWACSEFSLRIIMILFSRFLFISGMVRIYLGRMNFVWVTVNMKGERGVAMLVFLKF